MDKYRVVSEYKTDKNVDRVRFFSKEYTLAALYHLDSGVKTGGLQVLSNENKLIMNYNTDYGILDIKEHNGHFYSTNSNSTFSCFDIETGNTNPSVKEVFNYKIPSKDDQNTCNTLDFHGANILLAMNDGQLHLYDIETSSLKYSKEAHTYGLWSCCFYDSNNYITGSEDSLMKMWDLRDHNSCIVNKTHTASVNTIQTSLKNEYHILTGSYDEHLRVIDIRKFGDVVESHKMFTIWDFKQVIWKGSHLLFTTCVYDGFKIIEYQTGKVDVTNGPDLHTSIVYGVDVKVGDKAVEVVSCSFYDNKVLFWEYI
jgi:WD40 repeat protein